MTYKNFNKANLQTFRKELRALFAKHGMDGVEFSVGKMKYTSESVDITVTATVEGGQTVGEQQLQEMMNAYSLTKRNHAGEELVSYKAANHKYPFIYRSGGKLFKCTSREARVRFAA